MQYNCPYKLRAFDGRKIVPVQSICFNQGGAIWYGQGNSFGWAWINDKFDGWDENNPKPSENDICPVMRWTGLKDKNGVDIWEGDIVEYTQCLFNTDSDKFPKHRNVIKYYADGGHFSIDFRTINHVEGAGRYDFNVIGNIYENKDLIKES